MTAALGAYALGALEGRERDEVEAHLLVCDDCGARRSDAEEAVTALLGPGDASPPPPEVWEKIQAELRRPPS